MIGPQAEFEGDGCRIVTVAGRSLGIYKVADGFLAVRNVCPHKGAALCRGPVDGTMVPTEPDQYAFDPDRLVLRCPWHGWEFALDSGQGVYGAAGYRVALYRAYAEDGNVVVDLDQRIHPTPQETIR